MPNRSVAIELTADEALVLFEFAWRFRDTNALSIEHGGETAALWHLCAALERILVEPFRPDYEDLLAAARDRLAEWAGTASS